MAAFTDGMSTTTIHQIDGTSREEYSSSVSGSFSRDSSHADIHMTAEVVDGQVQRQIVWGWVMGDWSEVVPRGITAPYDRDADGCRPCRDGRVGRHSVEPGRLLIRDAGLPATETERLMEITPMITRPAMTTDFIWSLGHSYRLPAESYEVDYTDYQTVIHDADLRDEAFRQQLSEFGSIRPGTLGRVLSAHIGQARLDRCRVRSGERALDSALRLAFVETHTASDTLSLDVAGTDDDGAESTWIPTTGSLLERWMAAESDAFRADLEAIDWVQRRLTDRQWECLTSDDLSSSTTRESRRVARQIIESELPASLRIRRRLG
jgi:hypothetical protein